MFKPSELKNRGKGYTFDDLLIVPQKSEIKSRREPDLSSQFTKKIRLETPFISANMDTITESEMAIAMFKSGGIGILHRFASIEDQVSELKKVIAAGCPYSAASIGVNQDFKDRAKALVKAGCKVLTVDIAHGHSVQMLETLKWLKDTFADIEVVAGNVATPDAVIDLAEAGADAIKVGIGPGSMCTTRIITGCGVPQLTAISLCAEAGKSVGVPIIADGGIKTSGDIVKAFCVGAQSIMLGSRLSGTLETPGPVRNGKKQYRGMASKAAQDSWRGGVPTGMAAEGEDTYVAIKGHVADVVNELAGGLRSGMSYINSTTISEMELCAQFMEMSSMGYHESRAHGVGV